MKSYTAVIALDAITGQLLPLLCCAYEVVTLAHWLRLIVRFVRWSRSQSILVPIPSEVFLLLTTVESLVLAFFKRHRCLLGCNHKLNGVGVIPFFHEVVADEMLLMNEILNRSCLVRCRG